MFTQISNGLIYVDLCYDIISPITEIIMGMGLSQWETALLGNGVSHWLSPYPEWFLHNLEATVVWIRPIEFTTQEGGSNVCGLPLNYHQQFFRFGNSSYFIHILVKTLTTCRTIKQHVFCCNSLIIQNSSSVYIYIYIYRFACCCETQAEANDHTRFVGQLVYQCKHTWAEDINQYV